MTLKQKAITGVKWTTLSKVFVTSFQLIQLAVLARYLLPVEFGLMAIVMVVIGFSQAFMDMGISNAIIYNVTNNSNAILGLEQQIENNSNALIYGITNNSNAVLTFDQRIINNSNAVQALAAGGSPLAKQNSDAILYCCKNASNAILALVDDVKENSSNWLFELLVSQCGVVTRRVDLHGHDVPT